MTRLHDLLVDSARRTPECPAIHEGSLSCSYGQLDRMSAEYAAALRASGVRPGDRVVVWARKSADTIALMQGVLRAGAMYVPLAPANPASRVQRIVRGCSPALVVSDVADRGTTSFAELRARGDGLAGASVDASPDAPAYILFTSGSTGEPKGVCISHRNATAFVEWGAAETGLNATDRLANHAPLNFDLSVFDLYGAFLVGAAVDLVPEGIAYQADALVTFLGRGITVWYSVPSALLLMMRHGRLLDHERPAALRVCVFAGEPFPAEQVRRLRAHWRGVRMFNWYGPTETNVCTSYELPAADLGDAPLPIGSPASGAEVWLDDGEIVVAGPTVMLGYWGAPRHRGPYRTGDFGHRDVNGLLRFAGRRDAMVKVRGHRIETGEVEAALSTHPAVAEVAVVAVGDSLDARLHAVVVPAEDHRPGVLTLKAHCARLLPAYMIIDSLSLVSTLPRTDTGKTDRSALSTARHHS